MRVPESVLGWGMSAHTGVLGGVGGVHIPESVLGWGASLRALESVLRVERGVHVPESVLGWGASVHMPVSPCGVTVWVCVGRGLISGWLLGG